MAPLTALRRADGACRHIASWDRRDAQGRLVSAGVYVARLRALGRDEAAKIVVID